MGKWNIRFYDRAAQLALLIVAAGLVSACGGSTDPEMGNNNTPPPVSPAPNPTVPTPTPSDDCSTIDPVKDLTDPSFTINIGPDFEHTSPAEIYVNAGGINATKYCWMQISGGTTLELINDDQQMVTFLPPKFPANTPLETRTVTLRLIAINEAGFKAYDDVIITVPPELQPQPGNNTPPRIDNLSDVIASPGQLVELTASAEDMEDGIPSFRWFQFGGPDLGLTDAQLNSDTISFIAPQGPERIWFIVRATDSDGDSDRADVLVEITGNIPPTVNAGGDITTAPGELVSILGTASDSDGSIAQFQWQDNFILDLNLQNADSPEVSFVAPNVAAATDITLTLTVTDDQGETAQDQVVVTVDPFLDNNPPTANAGPDQVVNLGDVVALSGSANDTDGTIELIAWQQTRGPEVDLTNADTETPSFTVPDDMQGETELEFQLTVIDDLGSSGTDQVVITVNRPPIANAGVDQSVRTGDTVNLVGTATELDAEDSIVSYAWTQINGPTVDVADNSSGTTSFETVGITGVVTYRLTVTDSYGAIGTDDIVISIDTTNIPPVADAGMNISVTSGDPNPVEITGSGSDTEGTIVSFEWMQVSGPMVTLNGVGTPTVSFTVPTVSVTSIITLRLTVTDDAGDSGSADVDVTVVAAGNGGNNSPQANAGVDQIVNIGDLVILSGEGSDPDLDPLSYQWAQVDGPAVTIVNDATPTASFIAPSVAIESNVILELTVTDTMGASHSDQVVITILTLNSPPTADAGPDQNVESGGLIEVVGGGSDPDGNISTYEWTQLGGPTVTLLNADTANVSFVAPVVSSNTMIRLRLTVTDTSGESDSDDVVITVIAAGGNASPIADAGADRSVISGQDVIINGSGMDDGVITVYVWTQVAGTVVVDLIDSATSTVSFVAPQVTTPTNITLRLTVVDDMGALGSDDVVITISPGGNASPVVNAGPDRSVSEEELVTIVGSANDANGISSYQWSQVNGITVTLVGADSSTVEFTAPAVGTPSNITLRLTATDSLGASGSDDVVVTVNPSAVNQAPSANAGPDVAVLGGASIAIVGSGQDNDGSVVGYQWEQISGNVTLALVGVNNPSVEATAPNISSPGNATLRLTVTDNLGATGFDDVVVSIQPGNTNLPPVVNAGPDQDVSIHDIVVLGGTGTDADGTITGYQWLQTGGPTVNVVNADLATAGFQAPIVDADTALTFDLTVTDNAGDSATDTVVVTVHPFAVISGTVTVASGTQVDSDVFDPFANNSSNDSIANAQSVFNPLTLGGYANVLSDPDDYFAISLSANQVINLYIGDITAGDLDLALLDQNGVELDVSAGPNATENLVVNNPGIYYINVRAVSGASNYVLSVGVSTLSSQSNTQSNGWRVSDDFKEGEVIVTFNGSNAGNAQTLISRASSVGLQAKAGATGRSMLLGLGNTSQKATALARLGVNTGTSSLAGIKRAKLETILAAKALLKRPDVAEVSLNYRYYPTAIPNDNNYDLQWHFPSINLPQAWDITTGSPDVIVAVIDTGVLLNHPDLQGQLVPGYDFISDNDNSGDGENGIDPNPDDPGDGGGATTSSFHGTHVAGTIAAASNNSQGVAGVAWGVRIMPCRAIGINGGLQYDIEQCVRYASGLPNDSGTVPARPADIINLSLGGPTNTTNAPAAYRNARSQGVIVVAAAGNDSSNQLFAPASYNGVVSVSATNINRQLASYSNFGSTIDVAAPGGDSGDLNGDGFFDGVLSTGGDDSGNGIAFTYRFAAGTSMSSPHMAGVAALMKSVYPDLTPALFDTMLANGELTDDAGSPGRDNSFGYGIINAQKAVQAAANAGAPAPPPPAPAVLQVSPASLNFGAGLSSLQINVANAGEATLDITGISNNSGGWLSVSPAAVGGTGLGSYNVSINRNGLQEGVYTATITIMSSAGTETVSVIMQVSNNTLSNGGRQYIELIDMETMQVSNRISRSATNGTYDYEFTGVPFGTYHIRAGTDLDYDFVVCELGDACGAYPTMDIISQHIVIDGSVDVMTGLDFTTEFSVNLSVGVP